MLITVHFRYFIPSTIVCFYTASFPLKRYHIAMLHYNWSRSRYSLELYNLVLDKLLCFLFWADIERQIRAKLLCFLFWADIEQQIDGQRERAALFCGVKYVTKLIANY